MRNTLDLTWEHKNLHMKMNKIGSNFLQIMTMQFSEQKEKRNTDEERREQN